MMRMLLHMKSCENHMTIYTVVSQRKLISSQIFIICSEFFELQCDFRVHLDKYLNEFEQYFIVNNDL